MQRFVIKVIVLVFFFMLLRVSCAHSQQYQNVKVKATVLDADSHKPVQNVTVYLIPQGDTSITDFALSNDKGLVVLEKVTSGKYELNAELLGYKKFSKVYEITQAPGWELDLGTIGMEESVDDIDASSITAAGNPITISKDTVFYNASSFRVGENAMLEDLLKKMPGITVTDDGTATVNGNKVDRITVDGKTFFFGDASMAIKNLPAKIVERIKVSQEESKSSQMAGISTELMKETVMDVQLKEDYKEGWFGDARLSAGATLNGKEDNPLTNSTKFLYDGNAMASIYGKKDQFVFIGNAYNIQSTSGNDTPNISGLPQDDFSDLGGLTTAIRGGANYNTDRIKNFETTVSANYRHSTKDDRQRYSRTALATESGNLLTEGGSNASGKEDQLMVDAEMYKKKGKMLVDFTPRFYIRRSNTNRSNFADTYESGITSAFHTSTASSLSDQKQFLASGDIGLTGNGIGKPGRKIGFELSYSTGVSDGDRIENSLQTIDYDIRGEKLDLEGEFFYHEPLGKQWSIQTSLGSSLNSSFSDSRAFDINGDENAHYSSKTSQRFMQEGASVLMQYSNDTSTIKFGISSSAYNDFMDATLLGISSKSGRADWNFLWSPIVMYSWSKDGHDLTLQYSSVTDPASSRQMIPVPDISNSRQITTGNIYLKSSVSNSLQAYYNMVNYTSYTFLTIYATADMASNESVSANWFDNSGNLYAVPVNAKKPGMNTMAVAMLNQPFGKQKNFTLSISSQAGYGKHYSYQSRSIQSVLDLDNFDYKTFMDKFWGNDSGDRFYSGQSDFAESKTRSLNWGLGLELKYNKDFFTGSVSSDVGNNLASYSLNSAADLNVFNYGFGCDMLFQPGKGWEFGTDAKYLIFKGYASGYGKPELRWNLSFNKTIKAATLSLKCKDILNQERSLSHSVSSGFVEDSYSNVMGRTILLGVSFNFGKLNSNKTTAVSKSLDKLGY